MMQKIILGISSCLLGNKVRYDGGHKLDPFLTGTFGQYIDWVPVCPEAGCGLGIPREVMNLEGDPMSPRLRTVWTGIDHTARLQRWTKGEMKVLADMDISGYVFKARSPSCGLFDAKVFGKNCEMRGTGPGLFAKAFTEMFPLIPVEDEERMHDPALRENFVERVFVARRWKEYIKEDGSIGGLVAFHSAHKYLIMAHSQKHYAALGKMVAGAKNMPKRQLLASYIKMLMEGLQVLATPKKNTNALQHMAGYFKDFLSAGEKKELLEVITHYHDGLVPLIVPVTLLNHYVRKYKEPYLAKQVYLNPHPLELMLRNHV
ncbi:MAG: YbgA family protein [Nitrospirota bacterium]